MISSCLVRRKILKMLSRQNRIVGKVIKVGLRNLSTTKALNENYYETLGLTRDATQADIKKAYFELSKLYHPDKIAATDSNLAKFREISAAYEILGNEQSRKLYDRGLLGDIKKATTEEDITDPIVKFYKQRHDLSKSLTKTTGDSEAWAQTFFKGDKEKYRRHKFFKLKEPPIYEQDDIKKYHFGIFTTVLAAFLFSTNFEGTPPEKLWSKIFSS